MDTPPKSEKIPSGLNVDYFTLDQELPEPVIVAINNLVAYINDVRSNYVYKPPPEFEGVKLVSGIWSKRHSDWDVELGQRSFADFAAADMNDPKKIVTFFSADYEYRNTQGEYKIFRFEFTVDSDGSILFIIRPADYKEG